MKITMIAGYYAPERTADTHLNVDLAESFAAMGAEVTVLVPFPTRGVDEATQKAYLQRREERVSENLRILRIGEPSPGGTGFVRRGLSLLQKSLRLWRQARKIDTDVYFVVSSPPFLGYMGALLSRRRPVVYLLHDVFPDSLALAGKAKEGSLPMKLLHRGEKWVYKRLTQIHACSGDIRTTLLRRGVPAEKVSVVYNWIDPEQCIPVPREENPLFDRYGLPRDCFYVSYGGNIGYLQNLETVIKAAERLRDVPDLRFAIIGDGAWSGEMKRMLAEKHLNNVDCLPMQPLEEVSNVYSFGDVELVSVKAGVAKIAMPSKTWSILSAARPVLCEVDGDSELHRLMGDIGCGRTVPAGDDEAMAEAILALYRLSAEERRAMGERGRAYVCGKLNRETATGQHFAQLTRVVEREGEAP